MRINIVWKTTFFCKDKEPIIKDCFDLKEFKEKRELNKSQFNDVGRILEWTR